ncbi:site-specific DNA recombinase [Bacteroidales bacterium 6E]|nr:site-specific DNA recombinase [Bacteroidales bacterium 6E]
MRVKYNRVSTIGQSGDRFTADKENYDLVLLDKISGSVPFKKRPEAIKLVQLIEKNLVTELVVEELSRLGRNTGDVINNLEWLESKNINVVVRNIGLQSRPNNNRNPIWKMISSVMSSLYEMELENIKERTEVGRKVYVQKGGRLGRPFGTSESQRIFLQKQKSQNIIKYLRRGMTFKEISVLLNVSPKTIKKVKDVMIFFGET